MMNTQLFEYVLNPMMKRYYRHIMVSFCILLLAGCQDAGILSGITGGKSKQEVQGAVVKDLSFSDDIKLVTARVDQNVGFGEYHLDDTSMVNIVVREYNGSYDRSPKKNQPELLSVNNSGREGLKAINANVLALIDMTLDRTTLNSQKKMLEEIRYTFSEGNLFLTFMLPGGEISPIYPATPYILSTYTSPLTSPLLRDVPDNPHSFLYRSLTTLIQNLSECHTSSPLDSSAFTSLIVFSGSEVYDRSTNLPYDPQHYEYQETLIRMARRIPSSMEVSYIGKNDGLMDPEGNGLAEVPDVNIMKLLCNSSGGSYMEDFNWEVMREHIMDRVKLDIADFEILLKNEDGQLYLGNVCRLEFSFYTKKDSLLTTAGLDFTLGEGGTPRVVGTYRMKTVIYRGIMEGVLLMVLAFLIFQFVVPFVRYLIFRHKNVIRYQGPNMTVNQVAVPDQCYMCKAPFRKDDVIVVKCAHVVHQECWEENDCHCPEYGSGGCREGSHFYNRHDLLDLRNASFYMKWVIIAIAVATFSWLLFILLFHSSMFESLNMLFDWLNSKADFTLSVTERSIFMFRCYFVVVLATRLVFLLTLGLTAITVHKRVWYLRVIDIISRSVIASITVGLIFMVFGVAVTLFHISGSVLVFIPWSLAALIVAFISTWRSRIKPYPRYIYFSLGVGTVSAFLWSFYTGAESMSDISHMLIGYIFFAVGTAVVVARALPRHERYFLHMSGPVKELDVALYKWFAQKPDAIVSIGKSVDCSIQITWDLKSRIAPVQAEVRMDRGLPRLYAVDGTVTLNGETVRHDHPARLYHNDAFVIGLTTFRYIEI